MFIIVKQKSYFLIAIGTIIPLLSSCTHAERAGVKPATTAAVTSEVLSYACIDSVLGSMEKIKFEDLSPWYLRYTGYNRLQYSKGMTGKLFYKVTAANSNRYLVSRFRINEFLPKDSLWLRSTKMNDSTVVQYLCIDTAVLHRFLDLIYLLEKKGYNRFGFRIKDGYRYPNFNRRTGGAGMSQHMFGRAIDLTITDISGDGVFTESVDKKIVCSLLDSSVIKSSGGLGVYPGSNAVHFDTRGYRARW
jgi:hypothetical protein